MSNPTIRCTVLTSEEGDATRPWPRYRKVSPLSDPWIAQFILAKASGQKVSVVAAQESRPAKTTVRNLRFLEPSCELPPPLDDASIDPWSSLPRQGEELDEDISGVSSQGYDKSLDDLFDDEGE